jgi:iron complex outermembrane receptor protein
VLEPEEETLSLTSLFGQDTITLRPDLKLTLGSKFEYNSFSGFEYLPSVRIGWQATPSDFLWAAVSRAVRTPSRLDRELQAPGIVAPAPDFRSETLIAYEAGYRTQPVPEATLSLSIFYNEYDDLRSTAFRGTFAQLANDLIGSTWGLDAWGDWNVLPWWRLSPGLEILRHDMHARDGTVDLAGSQTSFGHNPGHQLFLRSYMSLPNDVDFFIGLRQIGSLSDVGVPAYFEADVRLGWRPVPSVELSIAGLNLVHDHHPETITPPALEIPRSVYAGLRWSF